MKKKILGGIAVIAIAAMTTWNVNFSAKTNGLSNVMLSNVEALAEESNPPSDLYYKLYCSNYNNYYMCGYTKTDTSCSAYTKCP